MKKQIIRISPFQTAKVMAVLYFILSFPLLLILTVPQVFAPETEEKWPLGFLIAMPFIYLVFGFVLTLIGAWLYNLVASWVGGIEITMTDNPQS